MVPLLVTEVVEDSKVMAVRYGVMLVIVPLLMKVLEEGLLTVKILVLVRVTPELIIKGPPTQVTPLASQSAA
jgi:hypothetical protein